jgi:hypothetical protein
MPVSEENFTQALGRLDEYLESIALALENINLALRQSQPEDELTFYDQVAIIAEAIEGLDRHGIGVHKEQED